MEINTTLFDTWQPGTTASAESSLFQVPQGGDSTHVDTFTNSRGAAQLPADESFLVKRVALVLDEIPVYADLGKVGHGSLVEIRVKDKVVFSAPAKRLFASSGYLGNSVTAAAALTDAMGYNGDGFPLDPPLLIPGGARFAVRCKQGVALSVAVDVKLVLDGVLTTPD
jgi:hypothetical protein